VIGGITVFKTLSRIVKVPWTNERVRSSLGVLSVFFTIFLLFNSGWVYEVAKDFPTSISLNNTIDYPRFNEQEILTGCWLKDRKNVKIGVYSDDYRSLLLWGVLGERHVFRGDDEITTQMPKNVYIFLGRENVKSEKIILVTPDKQRKSVDIQNLTLSSTLLNMNRIYNNGDAHVYYQLKR
jgi:uncharacterized membrane protein